MPSGKRSLSANVKEKYLAKAKNIWFLRILWRWRITKTYPRANAKLARSWVFKRTESSNFLYDLGESNRSDLIALLAVMTGKTRGEIEEIALELENDDVLASHIRDHWNKSREMRDAYVAFGRRLIWYVLIRVIKPRMVVETGIHHGVGACVIAAAIMRNQMEGFQGRYLGFDIDPNAGVLFIEPWAKVGELKIKDAIAGILAMEESLDLVISDSDHSPEYEKKEFAAILKKISKSGVIISDNSHVSNGLNVFSRDNLRGFLFFGEVPKDHWYPGGGAGLSFQTLPLVRIQSEPKYKTDD